MTSFLGKTIDLVYNFDICVPAHDLPEVLALKYFSSPLCLNVKHICCLDYNMCSEAVIAKV